MKVFTVGLDQKPPLEKAPDTPPPGYSSPTGATAVPMGPEVPPPIYLKKTKSYKGVLVCMLAVFLIGLFALTLSEIAYNRQRDENFFRLRWAELKHKMGYDFANAERVFTLRRQQELQPQAIVPENLKAPATTTTVKPSIVDNSIEKDADDSPQGVSVNDRLTFFRQLLERIKEHAEEMGFDGTMQVSVLQVDPEAIKQQLRERLLQQQQQASEESNMDGFGEWAVPQQLQQQEGDRSGVFRFDDYGSEMEQPKDLRFRGFGGNQWQPQQQQQLPSGFDHWTANRVDVPPFFPAPRPFWWQQQHQRPQTPFFFQQGPVPQQQSQPSFIQNEVFPQQQQQPQQPQVIFFPNHNINQFQQQPQQQQQQFPSPPEMNSAFHPQQPGFIAPEDRIQIEPPSTPEQLQRWKMNSQKPFEFKSNEGPRGWTHQENQESFLPPPPAVPLQFGNDFIPQPRALPPNGVPAEIEPKQWEHSQPLPAISIDPVSEPLPSWAIENSLESETPFAEIIPEESHESSQNSVASINAGEEAIPRPPSIQPEDTVNSHLHILPIKEVQGEEAEQKVHSGEVAVDKVETAPVDGHHEEKPVEVKINDEPEAPVAKEPEPVEVDFPAVKFPASDDAENNKHREPIFLQVDDPHPPSQLA